MKIIWNEDLRKKTIEKIKTGKKLSDYEYNALVNLVHNTKLGLKMFYEESSEELNWTDKVDGIEKNGKKIDINDVDNFIVNNYIAMYEQERIGAGKRHLLIEGDNFLTLKALIDSGKRFDTIYIDPPYNTGMSSSFVYNNDLIMPHHDFKHSYWLSFMKRRLELSREVMKDSGMMFIAIDEFEMSHLKLIVHDVFGEENYMGTLIIKSNPNGRNKPKSFATTHEYILAVAKDWHKTNTLLFFNEGTEPKKTSLLRGGDNSEMYERPLRHFPILRKSENLYMIQDEEYYNIFDRVNKIFNTSYIECLNSKYKNKGYEVIWPLNPKGVEKVWQREFFRVKQELGSEIVWDGKKIVSLSMTSQPKTIWDDAKYSYSHHGAKIVNKILGKEDRYFNYPKSTSSVADIIRMSTPKNGSVLDFFAGSGTTGHAVLELNNNNFDLDFTLVTNSYNDIARNVTFERLKRVMTLESTDNEEFAWKKEGNESLGGELIFAKTFAVDKFSGEFEELTKGKKFYKENFNKELDIELISEGNR